MQELIALSARSDPEDMKVLRLTEQDKKFLRAITIEDGGFDKPF